MPFTKEFKRIRRKFYGQYQDKAKADTFAFEEAFSLGIKPFRERKNFERIHTEEFNYEF